MSAGNQSRFPSRLLQRRGMGPVADPKPQPCDSLYPAGQPPWARWSTVATDSGSRIRKLRRRSQGPVPSRAHGTAPASGAHARRNHTEPYSASKRLCFPKRNGTKVTSTKRSETLAGPYAILLGVFQI